MNKKRIPYEEMVGMMESLNDAANVFQDVEVDIPVDRALERRERHKYVHFYSISAPFTKDLSMNAYDDKIVVFRNYYLNPS
jgi:hypothetical protein